MQKLKQRILNDGKVFPGNILKVDSFLNHQVDPSLMSDIADEFYARFSGVKITKVLTIEASGIGIALMTAARFGVPMVFAKKTQTKNIAADVYSTSVISYTHGTTYEVVVSKEFLDESDQVLIIDDFLALGNALLGLVNLVKSAGASVAAIGIVIEKGFQCGGEKIRSLGIPLCSLAIVDSMEDGKIVFREEN